MKLTKFIWKRESESISKLYEIAKNSSLYTEDEAWVKTQVGLFLLGNKDNTSLVFYKNTIVSGELDVFAVGFIFDYEKNNLSKVIRLVFNPTVDPIDLGKEVSETYFINHIQCEGESAIKELKSIFNRIKEHESKIEDNAKFPKRLQKKQVKSNKIEKNSKKPTPISYDSSSFAGTNSNSLVNALSSTKGRNNLNNNSLNNTNDSFQTKELNNNNNSNSPTADTSCAKAEKFNKKYPSNDLRKLILLRSSLNKTDGNNDAETYQQIDIPNNLSASFETSENKAQEVKNNVSEINSFTAKVEKFKKRGDFKNINISEIYICSLTHELMADPVITSAGQTYEKKALTAWIENCKKQEKPLNDPDIGAPLALIESNYWVQNQFAIMEIEGFIDGSKNIKISEIYMCNLTYELMTDPVITSAGQTYEKEALIAWIEECEKQKQLPSDPRTRAPLALIGENYWVQNRFAMMKIKEFINEPLVDSVNDSHYGF